MAGDMCSEGLPASSARLSLHSHFLSNSRCHSHSHTPHTGCSPTLCKRVVRDDIFSKDEADRLLRFLLGALPYGRGSPFHHLTSLPPSLGSGGPTIFDVHQGVLSFGDKFIDFYNKLKSLNVRPLCVADR